MALSFMRLVSFATKAEVAKVLDQKSAQFVYGAYIEHDQDIIHQSDIDEWLRTHTRTESCPYILGAPKPRHIHILLGFEQMRKYDQIRAWFKKSMQEDGSVANTFAMGCDDPAEAEKYLTHTSVQAIRDGKHQYLDEDLIILKTPSEDFELPTKKKLKQEESADESEALLQDILDHTPRREMARRYGRDYMKNWRSYEHFAQMVQFEETGEIDETLGGKLPAQNIMELEAMSRELCKANQAFAALRARTDEMQAELSTIHLIQDNPETAPIYDALYTYVQNGFSNQPRNIPKTDKIPDGMTVTEYVNTCFERKK